MTVLVAAEKGFSFADPYAIGILFCGVAVVAAIGALSHQHERAFSASLIYLGLGVGSAVVIQLAYSAFGCTTSVTSMSAWPVPQNSKH